MSGIETKSDVVLNVDGVSVYYGNIQVIWDVSLYVGGSELVALVGSNGAGKTTLLDAISGIHPPPSGRIEFLGESITGLDPYRIVSLGISHVPENRELFPDLSVLDNLIIGSYNRKARARREKNLKMVMQHFPILKQRKKQLAKTLSGGEQQMLAIGRGLMSDPRLILLDEMSLGLAPIIQNELYLVLKEIKTRGLSILLVEQNVRRSLCESDRAYVMERGKIVLCGQADELRDTDDVKNAYFGMVC